VRRLPGASRRLHCHLSVQSAIALPPLHSERLRNVHLPLKRGVFWACTTDRYGSTVARIRCDGIDANAEMVRAGMAWVFDKYVTDRSLYGRAG
jgi:Staphylococcal nuclease homologue